MDNPIANYILQHPEHCSLLLVKNKEEVVSINKEIRRPLASIYKWIIALAYLDQCTRGVLCPEDQVHFNQLKRYWIPWIDPAFLSWYEQLKLENKIKNNSVTLHEVVKGMLQYSSNTNTDYLLAIIGLDVVNKQLVVNDLKSHDPVVPISISVLISLKDPCCAHTTTSLAKAANVGFEQLIEGKSIEGLNLNALNDFDYERQCYWSDILPQATAEIYGNVLQKLQSVHRENVEFQKLMSWFTRLKNYKCFTLGGMKLGYTPKVFNTTLYAADHIGNEYQLIYFLNELNKDQKESVELASNDFNLRILKDRTFINTLKNKIDHVAVY